MYIYNCVPFIFSGVQFLLLFPFIVPHRPEPSLTIGDVTPDFCMKSGERSEDLNMSFAFSHQFKSFRPHRIRCKFSFFFAFSGTCELYKHNFNELHFLFGDVKGVNNVLQYV